MWKRDSVAGARPPDRRAKEVGITFDMLVAEAE
jgi:hypothetical protein